MLTGKNGIVTQANDAKVITEFSAVKEAVALKWNEIGTYKNRKRKKYDKRKNGLY